MKIIIEGADGTGKTTLAKILADKYGLEICHCTQHDPADFYFYRETLRKENVIWDRHTIGELIYPLIFDRKAKITDVSYAGYEFWDVSLKYLDNGATNGYNFRNNAAYDRIKTDNLRDQIRQSMTGRINDLRNDIERMKMALEYNDPRKIMEKGYSIIRDENGRVVRDADSVEKGQILTADLEKGRLKVETVSKESDRK